MACMSTCELTVWRRGQNKFQAMHELQFMQMRHACLNVCMCQCMTGPPSRDNHAVYACMMVRLRGTMASGRYRDEPEWIGKKYLGKDRLKCMHELKKGWV